MVVFIRVEGDVHWDHVLPHFQLIVEEGIRLERLLGLLGVPREAGRYLVNGRPAGLQAVLDDGDHILIAEAR